MRYLIIIFLLFSVNGKAQIIRAQPLYRPLACQGLLLDCYPNPVGAYSLRKINTSYSGNCIEVRRSSDNTTLNIGFTASGYLDTSALKTFIGANSGFIRTWYDQSGNNNNATQTVNNARQPRIVNAGTIEYNNNRVAIRFLSANTNYLNVNGVAASFSGSNKPFSYFGIGTNDTYSSTSHQLHIASSLSNTNRIMQMARFSSNAGYQFLYVNDAGTVGGSSTQISFSQGVRYLFSAVSSGTNVITKINATNDVNSTYSSGQITLNQATIGVRFAGTSQFIEYLNGIIQEIIVYASDQSSNRTGIESNINSYYSIY